MSNLLEKASILLTPTGYDNGSMNSIKPIKTLGSELVTNGDFATDSNWVEGTGWTISGGTANQDGSNGILRQSNVASTNTKVKVTFDLTNYGGSGSLSVKFAPNQYPITLNGNGSYSVFTDGTNSLNGDLQIITSSGFVGSIDNVSVKEVTGADFDFTRGTAATRVNSQGLVENVQILSGELVQNGDFEQEGSELVTNGDFATDSDWAKGPGWTISGGTANCDGSQSATTNFSQSNVISDQSKTYRVEFTLSNYVAGSVKSKISNDAQGGNRSANGTYVDFLSGMSNNSLNFTASADFVGSIDNVSVKEVGQNWTFGTGWSMGDGKAIFDGGNNQSLSQDGIVANNKKYRLTYTILNYVAGGINWRFGTSSNLTTVRSANGTYVEEITSTGSDFRGISSGASELSIDNVSIIEVTDDTNLPRIDYSPYTSAGTCGHWLLEPQSTNYSRNSEQPSTWHSNQGVTITANATTSPEGTTNASLVVINTSSGPRYTRNLNNFSSGSGTQTVTLSCFLKYYNNQFIRLKSAFFSGSPAQNESSFFDIQNGVLGTVSTNHTAKMEDYGNGWYRCSITFDIDKDTDTNGYMNVEFPPSDGASGFAAIGQGAYAFGSQGEELSFMTSYIPNQTTIGVTRNADEANNSGSSDLINSTEGVFYAEINALANYNTQRWISLSDGTHSNSIKIGILNNATDFRFAAEVRSGNSQQAFLAYNLGAVTPTMTKIAFKYKQNDFAFWVNGVERATDTSGNTPTGLSELSFDRGGGVQEFQGKVKTVAVFKEALTDAELTCLTS